MAKIRRSEREDRIRLIKATAGLVDQVLERGNVERANSKDFWLCPYHTERTGSFHVFDDGRKFKCFGCGVKGDAIDLVERIWRVKTGAAVHMLWKGLGHPGWTRQRLAMVTKRDSKTEREHCETVARMLWGISTANGYFLRRDHGWDRDDVENAMQWSDYYLERAEDGCDGQYPAPPAAYLGLIRVCEYLSRLGRWKLPRPSEVAEAWKRRRRERQGLYFATSDR